MGTLGKRGLMSQGVLVRRGSQGFLVTREVVHFTGIACSMCRQFGICWRSDIVVAVIALVVLVVVVAVVARETRKERGKERERERERERETERERERETETERE